jgi:hypothetical protein
LQSQTNKKKTEKVENRKEKKWVTFTFFGPETRTITKLFKNTDIAISYRNKNNIKHLLKTKENKSKNDYSQSGILSTAKQ